MNIKPNIYIVSVYQSNTDCMINTKTHGVVLAELRRKNIPYKELKGEYNRQVEESILLFDENIAKQIAKDFNQECYLYSDSNRYTSLIKPSGEKLTDLGILKTLNNRPNGDYSTDGQYYYTV